MNRLKRFALTGLTSLIMGLGAAKGLEARTLRVPSHYTTIQTAIDKAKDGDEVLVAPGIYSGDIIIDKQIALRSESGYSNTELVVGGTPDNLIGRIIYVDINNDESTGRDTRVEYTIDGFTINGYNPNGRGIHGIEDKSAYDNASIEPHGYILNNLIENCNVYQGIQQDNGTLHISNNIIRNNWCGIAGRTIYADHNLIYGQGGAAIVKDAYGPAPDSYITNNTIADNSIAIFGDGGIHFSNNIIVNNNGNQNWGPLRHSFDEGNNDIIYSVPIVWEDITKSGCPNISEDPQFCNQSNGDFTLNASSPCATSECGLIGALGVGCNVTPAKKATWGQLKAIYR